MIKFNSKGNLIEMFNLTEEDKLLLDEIGKLGVEYGTAENGIVKALSWYLTRAVIDERLSSNAKYFMAFSLGRVYETNRITGGGL
jgi:hypothetical protein